MKPDMLVTRYCLAMSRTIEHLEDAENRGRVLKAKREQEGDGGSDFDENVHTASMHARGLP